MYRFTIKNKKKAELAKKILEESKIKVVEDVEPINIPVEDVSKPIDIPVKKTRRKRRTKEEMAEYRKKKSERAKQRTPEQQKAINERMKKIREKKKSKK